MMILINGIPLEKSSIFPGGEVHVQIPNLDYIPNAGNVIIFTVKIYNSNDIMKLALAKEAIDAYYPNEKTKLIMYYLPYARQDRRCRVRESFSLKVFVKMIEAMEFSTIEVADIHNKDSFKLFNSSTNLRHLGLTEIFRRNYTNIITVGEEYDYSMVSPDKGADFKVYKLCQLLKLKHVKANKVRNATTGNIEKVELDDTGYNSASLLYNTHAIIVDDICDGGGTFIPLVEEMKKHKPKSITLYVTHGIFSRGLQVLFDVGIDKIITTDSITTLEPIEGKFEIWKL